MHLSIAGIAAKHCSRQYPTWRCATRKLADMMCCLF